MRDAVAFSSSDTVRISPFLNVDGSGVVQTDLVSRATWSRLLLGQDSFYVIGMNWVSPPPSGHLLERKAHKFQAVLI
jgi:hypothetical protein